MTIEEKAYDEALEQAKKELAACGSMDCDAARLIFRLFPQLRESEDEKIRRTLVEYFGPEAQLDFIRGVKIQKIRDWLEKQKENPQSADSIPSNCTSDAKCEDRWHKVTDSLPDNGREVLAKDKLGNTLLARYDGEGWDVSVYDDEDYRCHNGISKWCEIPSEKQKDHFRDLTKMIELQDYSDLTDLERAIHRGFLSAGVENVPVTIIKETANECKRTQTIANENANAEWSEEDKNGMFSDIIMAIRAYYKCEREDLVEYFKSLRPSWKPSEEQMRCLCEVVDAAIRKHNESVSGYKPAIVLKSLYEQLQKLM